jgi:hypothetical protein
LEVSDGVPVRVYSIGPDFQKGEGLNEAREPYRPENPYDPTNGIASNGDIWIDIPR